MAERAASVGDDGIARSYGVRVCVAVKHDCKVLHDVVLMLQRSGVAEKKMRQTVVVQEAALRPFPPAAV